MVRPAPVIQERIVEPVVDPNVILLRLEDAIDSLRSWLLIIGLVALAALAVAIYAVVDDDTSRGRGSATGLASDDRVSRIENRVDRLSRQVQDLRTGDTASGGGDTAALAGRIDDLEAAVEDLPSSGAASSGTQEAIDTLSSRIDDLARDVQQLKSSQSTP